MSPTDLKNLLDSTASVGILSCPFSAGDGKLTGRITTYPRKYDSVVHAWAKEAEDSGVEYTRRYTVAIVSYAISQINGVDFSATDTITLDETRTDEDGNEKPIVLTAQRYLRDHVIPTWDFSITMAIMKQFKVLQVRAEMESMRGVSLDYDDVDEAIADVETELAKLKNIKTQIEAQEKAEAEAKAKEANEPEASETSD